MPVHQTDQGENRLLIIYMFLNEQIIDRFHSSTKWQVYKVSQLLLSTQIFFTAASQLRGAKHKFSQYAYEKQMIMFK